MRKASTDVRHRRLGDQSADGRDARPVAPTVVLSYCPSSVNGAVMTNTTDTPTVVLVHGGLPMPRTGLRSSGSCRRATELTRIAGARSQVVDATRWRFRTETVELCGVHSLVAVR